MRIPPTKGSPATLLEEGEAALAEGRWQDARERFEQARDLEESGAVYEGLGWVGWWVADEELTLQSRERAYDLYLENGETAAAGRVATWLAPDFKEYRGEEIPARGWLKRAHRLIDDLDLREEHGWLALMDASFALTLDWDLEAVLPPARRAAEIGGLFGVADLETIGLAYEGMALTGLGSVEEGMEKLDEAASIAEVEPMTLPLSPAWAYCCILSACDGIGDFPRGLQSCDAIRRVAERWGGRQLFGVCRTSYGSILATGGDWTAAENELIAAVEDMKTARPGMASSGFYRLGELRARQSRTEEARHLFERSGTYGLTGLGELQLADGDHTEAADIANRVVRNSPKAAFIDRLPALELLVRASIGTGDLDTADRAEAEIAAAASAYGTPYVAGRASLIRAEMLAAKGSYTEARIAAEDAIDRFTESSAPYDKARAEVQLARVLRPLGREQRADELVRTACSLFRALGAKRDMGGCESFLNGDDPAEGDEPSVTDLTSREIEVLKLVARGMNNSEIAAELVVSPHTVHRHVANIRTKLRLPSRSAAVAWATRLDLL